MTSALTAVFERVVVEHEDRQRVERHVAADLRRRLDEPEAGERRVAKDRRCEDRGHRRNCGSAAAFSSSGSAPG